MKTEEVSWNTFREIFLVDEKHLSDLLNALECMSSCVHYCTAHVHSLEGCLEGRSEHCWSPSNLPATFSSLPLRRPFQGAMEDAVATAAVDNAHTILHDLEAENLAEAFAEFLTRFVPLFVFPRLPPSSSSPPLFFSPLLFSLLTA